MKKTTVTFCTPVGTFYSETTILDDSAAEKSKEEIYKNINELGKLKVINGTKTTFLQEETLKNTVIIFEEEDVPLQ